MSFRYVAIDIVRPSAVYGPRCVTGQVSQKFIENALVGKPLLLEGGGSGRLDFTHVRDVAQGIIRVLAVQKKEAHTGTFNITFGNARTIAELAGIVKENFTNAVLEERPRAEDKPIRGTLSTTRASEELGFSPDYTIETGYDEYCKWYGEQWERATRQVGRNDQPKVAFGD